MAMVARRGIFASRGRTAALFAILAVGGASAFLACGKKGEKSTESAKTNPENPAGGATGTTFQLQLTAGGLPSASDGLGLARETLARSLTGEVNATEEEEFGYPGIGINYGDVVLEGLKINLKQISMGENTMDGTKNPVTLAEFDGVGKELQISEGFTGKISVDKELAIPNGTYNAVTLTFQNAFQLKAYAYLDANNDGTIDTTIWTTATEIKKVGSKVLPADLVGYDYYKVKTAIPTMARNATDNSENSFGSSTIFRHPMVVADGKITAKAVDGTESSTNKLAIDVLIDTYNYVKVWSGVYGSANPEDIVMGTPTMNTQTNTLFIPNPIYPFPQGENDTRTGCCGVTMNQLFPANEPHFALSNYLAAFALVNSSGIKSQIYLFGKDAKATPFNTQAFTLVLDGEGEPQVAKVGIGEANTTLHIGPEARLFEKQEDGSYRFATVGSDKDAEGNVDGGLWYKDEWARAGFEFSGFRKLAVGQKATIAMKNGARCKGQYDYCVAEEGVSVYVRRVK